MVRLREALGWVNGYGNQIFQFQHGTIESTSFTVSLRTKSYFNSNMVRLRVGLLNDIIPWKCKISIPTWYDWEKTLTYAPLLDSLFQFQHGTIESVQFSLRVSDIFVFQFQHGTIESTDRHSSYIPFRIFQFQHGTIERIFGNEILNKLPHFNSNMVRLREG